MLKSTRNLVLYIFLDLYFFGCTVHPVSWNTLYIQYSRIIVSCTGKNCSINTFIQIELIKETFVFDPRKIIKKIWKIVPRKLLSFSLEKDIYSTVPVHYEHLVGLLNDNKLLLAWRPYVHDRGLLQLGAWNKSQFTTYLLWKPNI